MAALGLGAALGALLVAARRLLLRVTVDGASMAPALQPGDRVLAVRTPVARVRRGAVVVGRPPPPDGPPELRDDGTGVLVEPVAVELFVKRVVGVAGDRVRPRARPGGPGGAAVVVVPRGHYYVEGDGAHSVDSAWWGPVPAADVLGVVLGRRARQRPPERPSPLTSTGGAR